MHRFITRGYIEEPGLATETLPEEVLHAKNEFNKHRKLFIQNIQNISHEDVRTFLGFYEPADIVINKKLRHVIITLKDGQLADEVIFYLKSRRIRTINLPVELYPRRMMIYISGFPHSVTHVEFISYLKSFGELESAFLNYTNKGLCKGYGLAEFTHNRITVETVITTINGSTYRGNILYCGFVSDTIRQYDDTYSDTLYCIHNEDEICCIPELCKNNQNINTNRCKLSDGRLLYIMTCKEFRKTDQLYHLMREHRNLSCEYHYSPPALTQHQIFKIINNTEMKFPTADNKMEIRCILQKLFPKDPQMVFGIEELLDKMRPNMQGQIITTPMIMNMVKLIQAIPNQVQVQKTPYIINHTMEPHSQIKPQSTQDMIRVPDISQPPPQIAPHRPVTRSQSVASITSTSSYRSADSGISISGEMTLNDIISSECAQRMRKQPSPPNIPEVGQSETAETLLDEYTAYENTPPLAGPVTRQKRRTLETSKTPYSKTPCSKTPYSKTPGRRNKIRCNQENQENETLVLEVNLQSALSELFSCKREISSKTPLALRRLLPAPEKSPASPSCIGQHMQGIGGLYVSSYIPSKRTYRALW